MSGGATGAGADPQLSQLEYHVLRLDGTARVPKLLIRAPEVLKALKEDPESAESCVAPERRRRRGPRSRAAAPLRSNVTWHPEYGAWMIESALQRAPRRLAWGG